MRLGFGLLFLLTLLVGCSAVPERIPVSNPDAAWQQHYQRSMALDEWSLDGRIAIATQDDGWNANLRWAQRGADFELDLSGPFGQGRVRLVGGGDQVTFFSSEGERHHAGSAEQLLYDQTGWWLPVSGLRYWVKGVPHPGAVQVQELDAYGRLQRLAQDDWVILYRRYEAVGNGELPSKIVLNNHRLKVRLVIDTWHLTAT